jgi:hypothetical protein
LECRILAPEALGLAVPLSLIEQAATLRRRVRMIARMSGPSALAALG